MESGSMKETFYGDARDLLKWGGALRMPSAEKDGKSLPAIN